MERLTLQQSWTLDSLLQLVFRSKLFPSMHLRKFCLENSPELLNGVQVWRSQFISPLSLNPIDVRHTLVDFAECDLAWKQALRAPYTTQISSSNPDLQIVVGSGLVEPIHGPIWSRLELKIGVVVGNRCRVWGPLGGETEEHLPTKEEEQPLNISQ